MAGSMTAWKGAFWAFWAFALVSWILAIIALASVQAQCNNISGSNAVYRGVGLTRPDCRDMFGNYWWIIAFTFITLVGLAAVAGARQLRTVGMGFMAWLAVLAVLWINASDSFLGIKDAGIFSVGRTRLMSAAAIMLSICTLVLAFILGCRPRRDAAAGPMKY